jgi:hypothetical protein
MQSRTEEANRTLAGRGVFVRQHGIWVTEDWATKSRQVMLWSCQEPSQPFISTDSQSVQKGTTKSSGDARLKTISVKTRVVVPRSEKWELTKAHSVRLLNEVADQLGAFGCERLRPPAPDASRTTQSTKPQRIFYVMKQSGTLTN